MKYCKHCGNTLKPEARFCGKCGQVVKEEEQATSEVLAQQSFCPNCGIPLLPGIKFCTACGAPADSSTVGLKTLGRPVSANVSPAQNPPPIRGSAQPPVRTTIPGISPKKKRGRKIMVFAVTAVVLLAVTGAAIYFSGTFNPRESYVDLSPLYEEEKVDQAKIDSAAKAVENIFLTADTAKLALILSPVTLAQNREFFSELQPHMAMFGNDFKTRKFLYGTARFAVYEFSSADGMYTAEFCLGEDGKWKLMRF